MSIRYYHNCAGIHAAGPAWDDLGWQCVGTDEIDKFCCAVVKHHYPNIPQYGDTTKVSLSGRTDIDLLLGGTPCQGFSVAGKRGGLDDVRSNLAWNFLRLAAESRARWIIWENVPGASSTNEGQDLLAFAQEVGKLGYGFAWRTLDAQYFGVPQRRRRIFLVGYLGDWRPAAAVLFERSSMQKHSDPRKEMAPTEQVSPRCFAYCNEKVGVVPATISATLRARPAQSYYWQYPFVVLRNGKVSKPTPLECGRLQGFPDNWCQIPWKGKPAAQCPDGPQYKGYGNSIPILVLRRLGQRIETVERILRKIA